MLYWMFRKWSHLEEVTGDVTKERSDSGVKKPVGAMRGLTVSWSLNYVLANSLIHQRWTAWWLKAVMVPSILTQPFVEGRQGLHVGKPPWNSLQYENKFLNFKTKVANFYQWYSRIIVVLRKKVQKTDCGKWSFNWASRWESSVSEVYP